MSSRFIAAGDIARDQFDWGEAGWVSRPEFTGSRAMCVMDVTLQPGAGHPFHRHPDQEEIIWVREGRIEQWLEDSKQGLDLLEARGTRSTRVRGLSGPSAAGMRDGRAVAAAVAAPSSYPWPTGG